MWRAGSLLLVMGAAALAGCSRHAPPDPPAAPPATAAAASPGATAETAITLAVGVEAPAADEAKDAGAAAAEAPSISGKTILHVGDSMVGGCCALTRALEGKATAEGAKLVRDYKVSESILTFEKSTWLKELLQKHNPDIVIITLGANDALVPYPQSMASSVRAIAKRASNDGKRECWWMGPPMWTKDTGIVGVIRDNAAPCKFYDSSSLKLERGKDGIHPTDKGGADWASAFWTAFRAPPPPAPAAAAP